MYYEDEAGTRVYTLQVRLASLRGVTRVRCARPPTAAAARARSHKHHPTLSTTKKRAQKVGPDGTPTKSAHPARFSPDDKFSRERTTTKRRFGLLPTQQPGKVY